MSQGKRRYRRRKYTRKRRRLRGKNRLALMRSPMPKKYVTKLRYTTIFSLNPTTGIAAVHVFSCNGLYDPDITSIGHQPRGLDQLLPMYDHYTVLGARIMALVAPRNNATTPQNVGISIRDNATPEADQIDYIEQAGTTHRLLSPDSGYPTRLTFTVNPNKFLSVSAPLGNDAVKGNVSSNPTEQCYFHCWSEPMEGVDAQASYWTISIDYIVAFTEPKDLAAS